MEYTVYILKSTVAGRFYIGSTSNLSQRLDNHNRGSTPSTKPYRPWKVVYTEVYPSHSEALIRERQIKAYKGGEAFKKLIA